MDENDYKFGALIAKCLTLIIISIIAAVTSYYVVDRTAPIRSVQTVTVK